MPLTTGLVLIGATYGPSGGTSANIRSKGSSLNANTLYLDDSSAILDQQVLEVTNKSPVPLASAPNGHTQQRSKIFIKVPLLLDNGKRTVNTVSVEIACDPETDASERAQLRNWVSYVGEHSNLDALFDDGSTASV